MDRSTPSLSMKSTKSVFTHLSGRERGSMIWCCSGSSWRAAISGFGSGLLRPAFRALMIFSFVSCWRISFISMFLSVWFGKKEPFKDLLGSGKRRVYTALLLRCLPHGGGDAVYHQALNKFLCSHDHGCVPV